MIIELEDIYIYISTFAVQQKLAQHYKSTVDPHTHIMAFPCVPECSLGASVTTKLLKTTELLNSAESKLGKCKSMISQGIPVMAKAR